MEPRGRPSARPALRDKPTTHARRYHVDQRDRHQNKDNNERDFVPEANLDAFGNLQPNPPAPTTPRIPALRVLLSKL